MEDASRPSAGDRRLAQLDGLRGVAAIAVMLCHVDGLFGLTLGFDRAYLLVDLFFLLSGFVLGLAWVPAAGPRNDTRALLIARVRRLWPTIAAAAILGAGVHALLGYTDHLASLLLLALLVVPAVWQDGILFPLNGPQWSIFWELVANVAHLHWLRRGGVRRLVAIGTVMGVGTVAAIAIHGAATMGPEGSGWVQATARVGWSYSVGMLMARAYRTTAWRPLLRWWQAIVLPVAAVLVLPLLPMSIAAGDMVTIIVVFPAMFWLTVTASAPSGTATAWLTRLGRLSFPLYAVHMPLLTLGTRLPLPAGVAAAIAVSAALSMAAGSGWRGPRRRRPLPIVRHSAVGSPA